MQGRACRLAGRAVPPRDRARPHSTTECMSALVSCMLRVSAKRAKRKRTVRMQSISSIEDRNCRFIKSSHHHSRVLTKAVAAAAGSVVTRNASIAQSLMADRKNAYADKARTRCRMKTHRNNRAVDRVSTTVSLHRIMTSCTPIQSIPMTSPSMIPCT